MEVTAVGIPRCGCIAAALLMLTANSVHAGADPIDQITVQAQRDRLKHQVSVFVSNAIVQTHYDELAGAYRWARLFRSLTKGPVRVGTGRHARIFARFT
jgi:hypothetical protein